MKSHKNMSRLDFLKGTGALAAGAAFLPQSVLAAVTRPQANLPVPVARIATYQIVVPDQASAVEQQTAEKLQHYVSQMAHKDLAIKKESEYKTGAAFFIGQTRYAAAHKIDTKKLEEDGYTLHPVLRNLIIAGGSEKGTLAGVYGLLELWGFRMFTSSAIKVPTAATVAMPRTAVTVVPYIKYRTISYRDTSNPEYTNWHALSSRADWGLFVHTFDTLIPQAQYGKSHPEYFSLVNGQRVPGTQLCLSNPEVLAVLTASLKEKIAARPKATYWSVSQNDNDQYCHCDPCTALNTKYGNVPSGSVLWFTNEVARAVPDKVISTLAYWYTRTPPKGIQAESNVNIMLCNIESRRQGPVYETDPKFSSDLVEWGKIAKSILIWDYNIQFANLVSPFPNLHTLKPNIKFYTDQHVNSLFMQCNGQTGGEMAGLRAYLISKLMWDPSLDDSALMDEYLDGYYGKPAGRIIRQYIDVMKKSLLDTRFKLDIFGSPEGAKDAYLSADMLQQYNALFDRAEKAAASDPQLLTRVKVARLPIQYAIIQIGRNELPDTPRGMFAHTPDGKVIAKPGMKQMVTDFVAGCKADNVSRVRERTTSPDDYMGSYNRVFTKIAETQSSKSFGKKIISTTLPEGGDAKAQQLTDGIFGSWESWSAPDRNWIAYKGQHMDFVLDLGEVTDIHTIEMDFLNSQAQPDWNLLVLPSWVTYAISADGATYGSEVRIDNKNNPDPKVNPRIANIPTLPYRTEFSAPVKARYIKVHGESLLKMPQWHIRAGMAAILYSDQIVVT